MKWIPILIVFAIATPNESSAIGHWRFRKDDKRRCNQVIQGSEELEASSPLGIATIEARPRKYYSHDDFLVVSRESGNIELSLKLLASDIVMALSSNANKNPIELSSQIGRFQNQVWAKAKKHLHETVGLEELGEISLEDLGDKDLFKWHGISVHALFDEDHVVFKLSSKGTEEAFTLIPQLLRNKLPENTYLVGSVRTLSITPETTMDPKFNPIKILAPLEDLLVRYNSTPTLNEIQNKIVARTLIEYIETKLKSTGLYPSFATLEILRRLRALPAERLQTNRDLFKELKQMGGDLAAYKDDKFDQFFQSLTEDPETFLNDPLLSEIDFTMVNPMTLTLENGRSAKLEFRIRFEYSFDEEGRVIFQSMRDDNNEFTIWISAPPLAKDIESIKNQVPSDQDLGQLTLEIKKVLEEASKPTAHPEDLPATP